MKKEEIEQSRTSTIRRKLSTTDKVQQVDKYLKWIAQTSLLVPWKWIVKHSMKPHLLDTKTHQK